MTDLSPISKVLSDSSSVHKSEIQMLEGTSEDLDFPLTEQDPRTFPQKPTKSSKRSNSSSSISHRQKFRSKLDSLSSFSRDSPFDSNDSNSQEESSLSSNYTSSIPKPIRHRSSTLINNDLNGLYASQSPLDYLWLNADLDPLFPIKLINQNQMKSIMNSHYSKPLPECDLVFPWLHGIHHANNNQRDFLNSLSNFTTVNRNNFEIFQNQSNKIPSHYRSLIPVQSGFFKTEDHPSSGVIKGSITASEILEPLVVSRVDLSNFLKGFLKDLDLKSDQNEKISKILYDDCISLNLIPVFKNLDPEKGISLRNFNIQVSKVAQISDFIVYCFNKDHFEDNGRCQCKKVARLLYFSQLKHSVENPELVDLLCSTLILRENKEEFYKENPKLLAINTLDRSDSILKNGNICTLSDLKNFNNWESNYLLREKFEISKMSSATEILLNIWAGNTSNFETLKIKGFHNPPLRHCDIPLYIDPKNSTLLVTQDELLSEGEDLLINPAPANWRIFVSCSEGLSFPSINLLRELLSEDHEIDTNIYLDFPPSGSIGMGDCTDTDLISIINTCKLLYTRSLKSESSLIYCSDGYTESSLLIVLFMIYSTGKTLTEVIIDLHKIHSRPFFLFPTDVQLISKVEDILIHYSPTGKNFASNYGLEILSDSVIYKYLFLTKERTWFLKLNGSLPSRILPHLYLGSLNHANEFDLLKEFNIKRIVSVGETLSWLDSQQNGNHSLKREVINPNITLLSKFEDDCPITQLMSVNNVQDDGIDMLTHNLHDILNFIDEGYERNEPVLVHCRVGVSRSATVCIAEVMKRLQINLIKAYIFVRVRRLNIIIQPNLRFMYELVKWEESERLKQKQDKLKLSTGEVKKLGSPMKSSFDPDVSNDDDFNDKSGSKNLESVNLGLSESINSLLSEISDTPVSSLLEFRDNGIVPLRQVNPSRSPVHEKAETPKRFMDQEEFDPDEDVWLRDVDWHILCREIDALNKVYIRV